MKCAYSNTGNAVCKVYILFEDLKMGMYWSQ